MVNFRVEAVAVVLLVKMVLIAVLEAMVQMDLLE
jgi:hypothetical protein